MRIDLVTVPYRYDERGEGLGAGPEALLAAGLLDAFRASGREVAGPHEACLDPAEREPGRTAPNIGRLGADTARLVADARRRGDGALVLAGTRDLDEKETELLRSTEVRVVSAGDLRDPDRFPGVVAWLAGRCALLYLHVDLDVLDPRFVPSASTPSANGLTIDELVATMGTVLETGKVAAVAVTSLNPGAGARGQRSVASTMKLLEGVVPVWTTTPEATVTDG